MSFFAVLWQILLLPFKLFGYQYYCISDLSTITIISKKIKYSIARNEQNEAIGFFIDFYYVGFITEKGHKENPYYLYCLCKEKQFNELIKNDDGSNDDNEKQPENTIPLYIRKGNHFFLEYKKRNLICTKFVARKQQIGVIEKIKSYYNKNNNCVAMISGSPGSGKSVIGILLAKELNGSLCKTYSPITPGDTLENIYNTVAPTKQNPLIILLDEFDVIIDDIHHKRVQMHKDIPIEVYNKITWNNLLDDISIIYPYTIIVLTTNLNRSIIESYDKSYVRQHRVNIFANL